MQIHEPTGMRVDTETGRVFGRRGGEVGSPDSRGYVSVRWNKPKEACAMYIESDCGKYRINKTGTEPPVYMAVRCVPPPSEILAVGELDDCKAACAAGSKRK